MRIFGEPMMEGTIVGRRIRQGDPEPDGPRIWMDGKIDAPTTVTTPGYYYQPMRPGWPQYQLLLDNGRRRAWVNVDSHIYKHYANGDYLDLNDPYGFLFPEPPPEPIIIGTLATTPDTTYEVRELWYWLTSQIKQALEPRTGEHTFLISGAHNRRQCLEPSSQWGTIIVSVEVQGLPNARSIALFDAWRSSPGLIRVRHGQTAFSELRMSGLRRTIGLIIADLGI